MITLSYNNLKKELEARSYPFYTAQYDLNLFGIRAAETRAGHFDDTLGLAWVDEEGEEWMFQVPGTTDPGAYYLERPLNWLGTAILAPGHYPKMYRPGKHRGKYRALVQVGPCVVIRDNNRDRVLDYSGKRYTGLYGINFHRALAKGITLYVGPHSAGCQVVKQAHDLDYTLSLADKQKLWIGSDYVSYSLLFAPELVTKGDAG